MISTGSTCSIRSLSLEFEHEKLRNNIDKISKQDVAFIKNDCFNIQI